MPYTLSVLVLSVLKELGFTAKQALTWIEALSAVLTVNTKNRPSKPQAKASYGSPKANAFSLLCAIALAQKEGFSLGMVDIKNISLLSTGAAYSQAVSTLLSTGFFSYEVDPIAKGFPVWKIQAKTKKAS